MPELRVEKHSKKEFFPTYEKWLAENGFPYISDLVLPENVFVAYSNDIPCYAVWFYHTDSKMCQIGFPAGNKNINYKIKEGAFAFLFKEVSKYAKRKGYLRIFTTSATESVVKAMIEADFVEGEECKHYFKIL